MKTLTVVFTYNRPVHLDNCLRSLATFGPDGPVLVVDDGSSNPAQSTLLDQLERSGAATVWRRSHEPSARLGGLYANMAAAYAHALEEGVDLLHFIQDDQQVLWRDEEFWARGLRIFQAHPDALEVSPGFDWLIFSHVRDRRNRWMGDGLCWKRLNSCFMAPGLFYVPRMREHGWSFATSEVENDRAARAMALALYASAVPCVGKVPDAPVRHAGRRHLPEPPPPREFYLRPLEEAEIARLLDPAADRVPLYEDYCIPWGWKAWAPYHYSNNWRKHLQNLRRWIRAGRFRNWPRRIGTP